MDGMTVETYVADLARAAKEASRPLGFASDETRTAAVRAMAGAGLLDGSLSMGEAVDAAFDRLGREGWSWLAEHGTPGCGLALPRRQELLAVLDRWRARG